MVGFPSSEEASGHQVSSKVMLIEASLVNSGAFLCLVVLWVRLHRAEVRLLTPSLVFALRVIVAALRYAKLLPAIWSASGHQVLSRVMLIEAS